MGNTNSQFRCGISSPVGWYCKRRIHFDGPCALMPRWWNIKGRLNYARR